MKYLILALFIALFWTTPAHAALNFFPATLNYASTTQNIDLSGDHTIAFSFQATNTTPISYILSENSLVQVSIYVQNGKLYFTNQASFISGQQGVWSTPIATSTMYQATIYYPFNLLDASNPEMWLNGTKRTVTTEIAPLASSIVSNLYIIGSFLGLNTFNGTVYDLGIFSSKLSDSYMRLVTTSRIYRLPLQIPTITNYWELNEVPQGVGTTLRIFRDLKGTNNILGGQGIGVAGNFLSY